MKSQDFNEFGKKLREARKRSGLNQTDAAHKAGISQTYLSALERGENRVNLAQAIKFAEIYGVSLSDIAHEEGLPKSTPLTPGATELAELLTEERKRNRDLEVKAQRRDEERALFAKLADDNKRLKSHIRLRKKQIVELKAQLAAKNDQKVVENHIHDKESMGQYHGDDINHDLLAAEAALKEYPEIVKDVLALVAVKRRKRQKQGKTS